MDRSALVEKLCEISHEYCEVEKENTDFQILLDTSFEALNCPIEEQLARISSSHDFLAHGNFLNDLRFIILCFRLIDLINIELDKSELEILSVQETKNVKSCFKNIEKVGILKNIQPNLPHSINTVERSKENIIEGYNVMKYTIDVLVDYMKMPNLRMLILPHCLQAILVGLYQISFCPLKKPTSGKSGAFVMSQEMYEKLLADQQKYRKVLETLRNRIHPAIFVRETMGLFQKSAPLWLKKSISATLTSIMRSENGLEQISQALFDGNEDDTAKNWQIIDVLTKLITSGHQKWADFRSNICVQLINLLKLDCCAIYERLVVGCVKTLYFTDAELCKTVLLPKIIAPLFDFAYKERTFCDGDDITDDIKQSVRLITGIFIDNSVNIPCVPVKQLDNSVINIAFHFYHLTLQQSGTLNSELKTILMAFIKETNLEEIEELFDNLLFGINGKFRDDITMDIVNGRIIVKKSDHRMIYTVMQTPHVLVDLLTPEKKFNLFMYSWKLLKKMGRDVVFGENLEGSEDDAMKLLTVIGLNNKPLNKDTAIDQLRSVQHEVCQKMAALVEIFEIVIADTDMTNYTYNNPDTCVDLLCDVLKWERHQMEDVDGHSQLIVMLSFIHQMVLRKPLKDSAKLLTTLDKLHAECPNTEVKNMCRIIKDLFADGFVCDKPEANQKHLSEFEQALHDYTDPLLPVRGHSLLTLTKLIGKKDAEAMENKYKLLTLFQISLKDPDSFIYLNAIGGLAAMSDLFPGTILEVLCEEFVDFPKKTEQGEQDGNSSVETRMKVGEVLMRVVKLLGEMAPKYKSLLLNTFLCGVRDEDHLIRASSLVNLGEVCRVLGYKLGTILSEVLVCVHSVIATDKAAEARRAAVTVLRQLFAGLDTDIINVLKEDILHIYRTLKEIYNNDKDDIVRLQAQLALEELNENVKKLVLAEPKLHFDKKVVLLD